MKLSNILKTTGAFALIAGTAHAQGFSGTASFEYDFLSSISPDGSISSNDYESTYEVSNLGLDIDWTSAGGYTYGANAVFSYGSKAGAANDDSFSSGTQVDLRFGRDFGTIYAEVFAGYLDSIGEDNGENSIRYFGGIAASYEISNNMILTGQIGYLDGTEGTDDDGMDGLAEAVFASIGTTYNINNSIAVGLNVAGASGVMDDDTPRESASIWEVQANVHYIPAAYPAWDIFATVSYASYFQGDDEYETLNDTSVGIGVAYHFGATSVRSAPVLPLAKWVAVTAGPME
ncbi:MAG: hypothetical protein V3V13_06880 [Paracoccaceae bacterium]